MSSIRLRSSAVIGAVAVAASLALGVVPSSAVSGTTFTTYDTQISTSASAPWTTATPASVATVASAGRGDVLALTAAAGASTSIMHNTSSGTFAPLDSYLPTLLPMNYFTGASTDDSVPASSRPSFDARLTSGSADLYFDFLWEYSDTKTTTATAVVSCKVSDQFALSASWTTVDWSNVGAGVCPQFIPQTTITTVGSFKFNETFVAGTVYRSFNDGNPSSVPLMSTSGSYVSSMRGIGFHMVNTSPVPATVELDSIVARSMALEFTTATAPSAVTPTLAAGANRGITASWTAPTEHGAAVTGYTVSLTHGSTIQVQQAGASATSLTFDNLPAGTYTATVVAASARGNSSSAASQPLVLGLSATAVEVSVSPTGAALEGAAVTVTGRVTSGITDGTVAIFDGSTKVGEGTVANGSYAATITTLARGTHSFTAKFSPTDGTRLAQSTSAAVSFVVNVKQSPQDVTPPPATTAQLLALVDDESLKEAVANFTNGSQPLTSIDTSKPLSADLVWSESSDSFVDVYIFSTPVRIGTFPVVNGVVQMKSADLPSVARGSHHLVFIGQTSGALVALPIQVAAVNGALASTGTDVGVPAGIAALLMAAGVAALLRARRNARRAAAR